jgi:hypothetical protein
MLSDAMVACSHCLAQGRERSPFLSPCPLDDRLLRRLRDGKPNGKQHGTESCAPPKSSSVVVNPRLKKPVGEDCGTDCGHPVLRFSWNPDRPEPILSTQVAEYRTKRA